MVVALALSAAALSLALTGGPAEAEVTQAPEEAPVVTPVPTTLPLLPDGAGRIIKPPNYGHEPTHPGDRGGWEQILLFFVIIGGVSLVVLLGWRDARRGRARQRAGDAAS